jgi:hypothetical protein
MSAHDFYDPYEDWDQLPWWHKALITGGNVAGDIFIDNPDLGAQINHWFSEGQSPSSGYGFWEGLGNAFDLDPSNDGFGIGGRWTHGNPNSGQEGLFSEISGAAKNAFPKAGRSFGSNSQNLGNVDFSHYSSSNPAAFGGSGGNSYIDLSGLGQGISSLGKYFGEGLGNTISSLGDTFQTLQSNSYAQNNLERHQSRADYRRNKQVDYEFGQKAAQSNLDRLLDLGLTPQEATGAGAGVGSVSGGTLGNSADINKNLEVKERALDRKLELQKSEIAARAQIQSANIAAGPARLNAETNRLAEDREGDYHPIRRQIGTEEAKKLANQAITSSPEFVNYQTMLKMGPQNVITQIISAAHGLDSISPKKIREVFTLPNGMPNTKLLTQFINMAISSTSSSRANLEGATAWVDHHLSNGDYTSADTIIYGGAAWAATKFLSNLGDLALKDLKAEGLIPKKQKAPQFPEYGPRGR